ncbi:hypothetical protein FACS1894206_09520 [Deltaproteobacteria bacterium]|nr:hypothetical protein FACS1894206_09520 [Deltaproteobacteria bacterium]
MSQIPIQATGAQAAQQAQAAQIDNPAQAAQAQAQPQQILLPNPADILEAARQRFPTVDARFLRGTDTPITRSLEQQNMAMGQLAAPPRQDVVPILAGRASLMPTAGVRGADRADKAAAIQGYVREGKDIYDRIMRGDYARNIVNHRLQQPHKRDVAKLMWYLQALASSKAAQSSGGQPAPALFREGAMFVEDRHGRLEAFLTSANSYPRSSSHLRAYQNMGRQYHPHGVDLRNVETPNQRKTILFARMPGGDGPAGGPRGTGDKRMLFVKMEPHGCRGLTPRGSGTPGDHITPGSVWKGVKRFFLNAKDTFMHGTGFVRSLGQRSGRVAIDGQNNRERIPKEIKDDYQRLLDRVEAGRPFARNYEEALLHLNALKDRLLARQPLSDAGGIKQMIANLDQARTLPGVDTNLREHMYTMLTQLRSYGDHPELRIGNEVILTRDELEMNIGSANPIQAFTPESAPVHSSDRLGGAVLEQSRIGREYTLADLASRAGYVEQFGADAARGASYTIGGMPMAAGTGPERFQQVRDAIVNLTGEQGHPDAPVASAIMSIFHQGFSSDISSLVDINASANFGVLLNGGYQDGHFTLGRRDTAEGGQIYSLSYNLDKQLTSAASFAWGGIDLDPAQSHLTASVTLEIQVAPDRHMSLNYAEAPGYDLTLTPALPQQPAQQPAQQAEQQAEQQPEQQPAQQPEQPEQQAEQQPA